MPRNAERHARALNSPRPARTGSAATQVVDKYSAPACGRGRATALCRDRRNTLTVPGAMPCQYATAENELPMTAGGQRPRGRAGRALQGLRIRIKWRDQVPVHDQPAGA